MFVQIARRRNKSSVSLAVKVVESYRQKTKIKKKVLLYIGSIASEDVAIEILREKFLLKAKRLINQCASTENMSAKLMEDLSNKLISNKCRSPITDTNCNNFEGI